MRIRTDDELRRVDARWLGPPRVSFPWPATRYVAYGVGFVVFLLVGWLFARFAEVTFWTMLYTLLITIGVTGWICKRIDDERPLSTLPAVLWAELGTPRRSAYDQPQTATVVVGRADVRADRGDRAGGPAAPTRPAQHPPAHRAGRAAGGRARTRRGGGPRCCVTERPRTTRHPRLVEPARPGWAKAAVPGEARLPMRTRQVVGHVTLTGNTGTAWYRLDPVPWSFRPDRDREQHILSQASVLAGLSGQLVRIRGTQVPFPVREWAEAHHRMVTERQAAFGAVPLPCWPDLLAGEQRQFLGEHLAEKQVYLGVDYLHRSPLAQLAAGVLPRSWRPLARELNAQQAQAVRVGHVDGPAGDARHGR